jgi:hypothetical protein
MEVYLHSFFTSAIDGVSCELHALAALSPWKESRYPLNRTVGGPHSSSGGFEEQITLLPLPGIEPQCLFRPSRSLVTNTYWAIPASFFYIFLSMAQQPLVGPGSPHYRGFTITHSDTPQSVGLLWTRDQSDAETSTWQHTTLTRDRHSCPRRDSNPQSQQASGRRPTP